MKFLVWFLACFWSTLGVVYFYSKLVGNTGKIKKLTILVFGIGVTIETFIKYYDLTFLSVISYFVFYPLIFYIIKPDKFKKIVYYTLATWVYGALFDFLVMIIISLIGYVAHLNIFGYWYKLFPTFFTFVLYFMVAHNKLIINYTNKFLAFILKVKYVDVLLIILVITFFAIGFILTFNITKISINLLLVVLLFFTCFTIYLLVDKKMMDYENKMFLETLKLNNNFYIEMSDNQDIIKHNLIAKLLAVESVANKKARVLINELIKDFNNIDYEQDIKELPYGLNGIISQKIGKFASTLDIKITNMINEDIFSLLSPKRYNVLVEKLVILLDNAIDASLKSVEKILIINLNIENNNIVIEIKNTFGGTLDIENLGKIHYSTKKKKSGIGLYSALRNNEVNISVNVINEYFVALMQAKIKEHL